mmetsp:Transcript_11166/g.26069  ORF Transcript_11166/g.26069 Transcript_11166/m.26069 type:complete len:356 (-) Transcript_11166:409-1476(-)
MREMIDECTSPSDPAMCSRTMNSTSHPRANCDLAYGPRAIWRYRISASDTPPSMGMGRARLYLARFEGWRSNMKKCLIIRRGPFVDWNSARMFLGSLAGSGGGHGDPGTYTSSGLSSSSTSFRSVLRATAAARELRCTSSWRNSGGVVPPRRFRTLLPTDSGRNAKFELGCRAAGNRSAARPARRSASVPACCGDAGVDSHSPLRTLSGRGFCLRPGLAWDAYGEICTGRMDPPIVTPPMVPPAHPGDGGVVSRVRPRLANSLPPLPLSDLLWTLSSSSPRNADRSNGSSIETFCMPTTEFSRRRSRKSASPESSRPRRAPDSPMPIWPRLFRALERFSSLSPSWSKNVGGLKSS